MVQGRNHDSILLSGFKCGCKNFKDSLENLVLLLQLPEPAELYLLFSSGVIEHIHSSLYLITLEVYAYPDQGRGSAMMGSSHTLVGFICGLSHSPCCSKSPGLTSLPNFLCLLVVTPRLCASIFSGGLPWFPILSHDYSQPRADNNAGQILFLVF